MSYARELAKFRNILEQETENLLSQVSITNKIEPLHIQHRDTEMSYAVEQKENKEHHLILIDSTTEKPMYDVSVDCIELEELAEIADALLQKVALQH